MGASRPEQVLENLQAMEAVPLLTAEVLQQIDEAMGKALGSRAGWEVNASGGRKVHAPSFAASQASGVSKAVTWPHAPLPKHAATRPGEDRNELGPPLGTSGSLQSRCRRTQPASPSPRSCFELGRPLRLLHDQAALQHAPRLLEVVEQHAAHHLRWDLAAQDRSLGRVPCGKRHPSISVIRFS